MMKCLNITRLISREQDETLTVKQKMILSLHTAMCGKCRRYRQQISLLNACVKKVKSS